MSEMISAVFAIARSRLHAAADPASAVRTAIATNGTTISAIGTARARSAPAVRAAPTCRQRWTSQITQAASMTTPAAMLPFATVASAAPAATSVATTNASFASAYPRLEISHATPIGTSRRPPNATPVPAADRLMARGSWRPGRNGSSIAQPRSAIQSTMRMTCIVEVARSVGFTSADDAPSEAIRQAVAERSHHQLRRTAFA